MLKAVLLFLISAASRLRELLARLWIRAPAREWLPVDERWPTESAAQIDLFLFAQYLLEAGYWLPVIATWTYASDEQEARLAQLQIAPSPGFEALCVIGFYCGESLRYAVRFDLASGAQTHLVDGLDHETVSPVLDAVLGSPVGRLRRIDGERFSVDGQIVKAGDKIELRDPEGWRLGVLLSNRGEPVFAHLGTVTSISPLARVRVPVRPQATGDPPPPLAAPQVFGVLRRMNRDPIGDTLHGTRLLLGDRIEAQLPGGFVVDGRYGWDFNLAAPAYIETETRRIPLGPLTPVRRWRRAPA